MIELRGIGKTYTRPTGERVRALVDVTFRIDRGEFIAIVGTSGSGKSTMMNILGLLDQPSAGSYLLDGQDVAGLGVNDQARAFETRRSVLFFRRFTWFGPGSAGCASESGGRPALMQLLHETSRGFGS
jgi:putative ABC transport system ATP-binding protein